MAKLIFDIETSSLPLADFDEADADPDAAGPEL